MRRHYASEICIKKVQLHQQFDFDAYILTSAPTVRSRHSVVSPLCNRR
jgi:hypothetical protein